jgi:hypothetical protein
MATESHCNRVVSCQIDKQWLFVLHLLWRSLSVVRGMPPLDSTMQIVGRASAFRMTPDEEARVTASGLL